MINKDKYEVVIGLEVHTQLQTNSKLFCSDSAAFGGEPNTHISPISLAHPGTLPRMNKKAIEYAIKLGLALNCEIEQNNYFARKNYFYPDLPKGYQISQHTTPICKNGTVKIRVNDIERNILLNRIHIEEDAGKSLHDIDEKYTSIDLNRAGVPLLEIVSEPDLHSSDEAFAYITELRKLVRWLKICDGNMEEGSLRCDANISIRLKGETKLGTRVEVKNLNSIRNVKRAIDIEVERLIAIVESGGTIKQETRSFDADKQITFSLRTKEEADDYRYFPDPDLTPFRISDEFLLSVKEALPPLPEALEKKYVAAYNLSEYDAAFICSDRSFVEFFELITATCPLYKLAANWLMGPIKSYLNEHHIDISAFPLNPEKIVELLRLVEEGKTSFSVASSKVFLSLIEAPDKTALQIAGELNLLQEKDENTAIQWVDSVVAKFPEKVIEYRKGKKGLLGMFLGEIKKLSKGKADMQQITGLLEDRLNNG